MSGTKDAKVQDQASPRPDDSDGRESSPAPPKRFLTDEEKETMAKHLAPTIVPTVEMMHAQLGKAKNDETKQVKCVETHCIPMINSLAQQIQGEKEEIMHESAATHHTEVSS